MKITFTTAAKQRLSRYLTPNKRILLDFDDGVGPFSKVGGCSLDGAFRLIFVDQQHDLPDFDQHIPSNLGDVYIKGYSAVQLDEQMEVRFNKQYFTLPLVSANRTITDNLAILDVDSLDSGATQQATHDC